VADVHRRAAASAPRLTPDEVATRGFATAFRGLSELEVRNFLKRVAEEMTTALGREEVLQGQVADLQEQLANPPLVTEERLLDALGEETARVLRSAQESAEQIRSHAETRAGEVTGDAEAAARTTREEADADAAAMRDAAQTAAAAREQESLTFASETRATAEAEVAELRATADAEVAAAREQSTSAVASEIEAAKEAGRELVNEARAVRERILADLGRRRMLLQAQIDELRAGRDRLLDAYRVVKRTLGDATDALVQVESRAAQELSGPAPTVEVPPVDGELAALAGELTGESGPIPTEVEALFARLRGQSEPAADELPAPGPTVTEIQVVEVLAGAGTVETTRAVIDLVAEPEPADEVVADPPPGSTTPPESVPAADDRAAATPAVDVVVLTGEVTDEEARAAQEAVLRSLQRELGRKVKRTLQDEQNDVLDRIRTVKGRPSAVEVLPGSEAQVRELAATLRGPVDAAYGGGRAATGAPGGGNAPAAMVDGLASTMVERLHERLVDAIDSAGADDASITQRLGARYREFKGQELDAIVGDTLAAAWALGVYDAMPAGTILRWVAAAEGHCPDCDDNALEPTVKGEPFPTGQPHPPAHPGCRCLLVPLPAR
jgi:DivIVA domain-containing protein